MVLKKECVIYAGHRSKHLGVKRACLHWMLRPKRVKKKHFDQLYGNVGFFRMQTYARWVANLDSPLVNINDLEVERRDKKIFEFTVKYKNIEWSFSCSPSDLEGHKTAKAGNTPHFHFQMRLDKKPFINYSENHIAFTDEDLWKLAMFNQNDIPIGANQMFGAGMEEILSEKNKDIILDFAENAKNEEEAAFKFSTTIMAKPGEMISGDDLADLIREHQKTGVPMAKLLKRLDADVQTTVTPGNGVPEIAGRSVTKRNH